MQTKKSHEIPDEDWRGAPDLQDWIDKSIEKRKAQLAQKKAHVNEIPTTLKPANQNYIEHFQKAKFQVLRDIGVELGNSIVVELANGVLTIKFLDPKITIEPHKGGMVLDFHTFKHHILQDLTSYVPTVDGITSCIFVFTCDNESFEYLINQNGADSLAFTLNFQGDTNA